MNNSRHLPLQFMKLFLFHLQSKTPQKQVGITYTNNQQLEFAQQHHSKDSDTILQE